MTPPRDGPRHQGWSCGRCHILDIGKHGDMPTNHCVKQPRWPGFTRPQLREEARGVRQNIGGFQSLGRRFKVPSTGPGAMGNTASPTSPEQGLQCQSRGWQGVDHRTGLGPCPRLSLWWGPLPESDYSGLGCPDPPAMAGSRLGHPAVSWGEGLRLPVLGVIHTVDSFGSLWLQYRCSGNASLPLVVLGWPSPWRLSDLLGIPSPRG